MADYRKMYAILCGAIDDVIDPLERIPLAIAQARRLCAALEEAEEVYLFSTEREAGCVIEVPTTGAR